jgi:hypothetical protein
MGCCLFVVTIFAGAQAIRKPGLWVTTSNMTWQHSPMPNGMTMPSMGPQTTQVCLTQAWIDKYGAPMAQNSKDCQISNVSLHATGMTADMVCTGRMAGKGTLSSSWSDGNSARGKVHFAGSMQMGSNSMPIEWTMDFSSAYKGADCGSVKPLPLPSN